MNSCPASILRLSLETPVKATSAPTSSACSGPRSSERRKGLSIGHLPRVQCLDRFIEIGEWMAYADDLLVILMALAGQQHDVIDAGGSDQAGDRLSTAGNEIHLVRVDEARTDIGEDLRRVFAARVVV